MPRLRRYLPSLVILLPLLFVCGKLLLTPVSTSVPTLFTTTYRIDIGWPWMFRQVYDSESSEQRGARVQSVSYHSTGVLLADIGVLMLPLALAAFTVIRRSTHGRSLKQFSLRTLLAATAVASALCGWWAYNSAESKREARVAESLTHCSADQEYCGPAWLRRLWPGTEPKAFIRPVTLHVNSTREPPAALAREVEQSMRQLRFVRRLTLHSEVAAAITDLGALSTVENVYVFPDANIDGALAVLGQCNALREVTIDNDDQFQPSDVGFADLSRSPTLEALYLPEGMLTRVTDDGIAQLATAKRIKRLTLPQAPITDIAIKSLLEMPLLESLDICDCNRLTDNGIRQLRDAPALQSVAIPGPPQISEQTAEWLAETIPQVVVPYPDREKTYSKRNGKVQCETRIFIR